MIPLTPKTSQLDQQVNLPRPGSSFCAERDHEAELKLIDEERYGSEEERRPALPWVGPRRRGTIAQPSRWA